MSRFSSFTLGLALPLTFLSQAALADLTPAQIWEDWRSYLQGMGYEITATETARGADLSVSDFTIGFSAPEQGGDMQMTLGTIDFRQNADGTVSVLMPERLPVKMTGNDGTPGSGEFTLEMVYTQSGHALTASGTPENLTYVYTADTVGAELEQAMAGGETLDEGQARMTFTGTNMRTSTTMTLGDMRRYDQSGGLDSASYDIFFLDMENGGAESKIKGTLSGISLTGAGSIPLQMEQPADMAAMIRAGFDVSGTLGYSANTAEMNIKDPENGSFVLNSGSGSGALSFAMGQGGITYDVRQRDTAVGVTFEGMPFPFEIAMAESGFKLAMPVASSEEEQDFALGITLSDFTMSDMIWSMFDPASQLPRDPATLLLDLSGKVRLLVDWLNPGAIEEMTGNPGALEAVNLNTLLVNAAGAKLEGSGAVTFDGAGAPLVPGVGTPVGSINLALAGGNGLLDKLVSMGLLPQDQAMGARMMMGLFAVPGDAPDTLKSRIEFTQDGQILANGQRIR